MSPERREAIRRVLIVGLGGAGQRQARVFRALLGPSATFAGVRVRRTTPLLDENLAPVDGTIEDRYDLQLCRSLDEGLSEQTDLVVIANPTALHLETSVAAAKAGCHVFVEKPLAHRLDGVETLLRVCEAGGSTLYVGYQRRFHPAFRLLRDAIREGAIGSLLSATFAVTSYVPSWHSYEDHRELYALRPELGGGVLLTESHELDLCHELFGLPDRVFASASTPAGEHAVDDTVHVVLEYVRERRWMVSLDLSFMSPHVGRSWAFVGSEGALAWREGEAHLTLYRSAGDEVRVPIPLMPRDELFVRQARFYLAALSVRREVLAPSRAVGALVIADAAQRSLESGLAEEPQPPPCLREPSSR